MLISLSLPVKVEKETAESMLGEELVKIIEGGGRRGSGRGRRSSGRRGTGHGERGERVVVRRRCGGRRRGRRCGREHGELAEEKQKKKNKKKGK